MNATPALFLVDEFWISRPHNGRWSFAAHKASAEQVLGVEARQHLVDAARANLVEYRVSRVKSNLCRELDKLEIAHLQPTNLVIDTSISTRPESLIEVRDEGTEHESAVAVGEPGSPARAVSGNPSKAALELMLNAEGFSTLNYRNWRYAGIKRWDDLKDYYLCKRVSVTATGPGSSTLRRA